MNMAEFIVDIMAELDEDSQALMKGWYQDLCELGFKGIQTPGLPYHFSLACLPIEKEDEAIEIVKRVAAEFAPVPFHIGHMGIFPGGKVLFGAPDMTPGLLALYEACMHGEPVGQPWVPHATILLDDPDTIGKAVPKFVNMFQPFRGKITRLHLCAFWPTREIISVELTGDKVVDDKGYIPGYKLF